MNFIMPLEELFGWIASVLTTLIFIPQIMKALKTRLTNDISMLMMILAVLGNAAWLTHASLTGNVPLIVCATLIIFMSLFLIGFKIINERH